MIFQTSNTIITIVEPTLWWLGSFIGLGLGIFLLNRMRKNEVSKRFLLGLSIFAFSYSIARIVENIRKFIVSTNYNDIFDAWKAGTQITGANYDLRIAYYIIAWAGIATFYFVSEKYVFNGKTHYLMTLASIIEGIVSVMNYFPGFTLYTIWISVVGFFIAGIFPIVLYLNMARVNTGFIRNSCIIVVIGIGLFVFGVMGDLPESMYVVYLTTGGTITLSPIQTGIVVPIALFSGMILMAIGFGKMFSKLT